MHLPRWSGTDTRFSTDALHITQTAITQCLRHLEDFLGVSLVERTTRSVALTALGEDFLPKMEKGLHGLRVQALEFAGRRPVSARRPARC